MTKKIAIGVKILVAAKIAAQKLAPKMSDRKGRPRTLQEKEEHCYEGLVGEMFHNKTYEDITAWVEHFKKSNVAGDDGGTDVPGKSINVKVITPGDGVVPANDNRAQTYVVYEYDKNDETLTHKGTFEREDIHTIEFPFRCRGVYVNELK